MAFHTMVTTKSQFFPQCAKYLKDIINKYLLYCKVGADVNFYNTVSTTMIVQEGFVAFEQLNIKFDENNYKMCTPADLELFVKHKRLVGVHTEKDSNLLLLLLKDRWFKGDFNRLHKLLQLPDYSKLLLFLENCLWERSYEDNYTLGQQLSIRMTTHLIQSGLDFKHQLSNNNVELSGRGWDDRDFEKILSGMKSLADITKRYKLARVYIMLELDRNNLNKLLVMLQNDYRIITNRLHDNVVLICVAKSSVPVLEKLNPLVLRKRINVLFVTDSENYLHIHKTFFVYNSMKFYYYCLKNKFIFAADDYETLYFLYTIIIIEYLNGGYLNSFTLEKSPYMHPLELNSRRCNALKRAANENKLFHNDVELKTDFIKGKRITTGTHCIDRIIEIDL
ncbi:p47 [Hyphantria cunea granulovirus]|uniref:P47 n=1 Tax=Hyphantria cunea granulovirus TaxID=307448 RepID=A0AAE5YIW5_9BBAC|nr:p47 [Hyphantria cunea granulovirus]QBQ01613.1 p47 [Hyphantria cunea granulovirus]